MFVRCQCRVCMGHGKAGKSWNWNEGHGKSWKIKMLSENKDKKKISQQQPGMVMESHAILEAVVADMC